MALSRALFTGISGLKGQTTKLDVIGNNIANVNTIGFKKSRVSFADLFSDTLSSGNGPTGTVGGTNPSQIGLGAATPKIEQIMTEGATTTTGVATDLSIAGDGFFVVGGSGNSNKLFTRDGNFKIDSNGDIVANGSSLRVKGWMASRDINGAFKVDTSKALGDLNINLNRKQFAKATDRVDYSSNLNSGSGERHIGQAETFINFKDDSSEDPLKQKTQKLSFTYNKINGRVYTWSANDTTGNTVATGRLEFNDFGEILKSIVTPAGDTQVNYDFESEAYPDIFSTSSSGKIDPNLTGFNSPDLKADHLFNPEAPDFVALTGSARPEAFSFTYDPDGKHTPGKWLNPHGVKNLDFASGNLASGGAGNVIDPQTGAPQTLIAGVTKFSLKDININNSFNNKKANTTLENYAGLALNVGDPTSFTGQLRVEVIPDTSTNPVDPTKMNVQVWSEEYGGVPGGPNEQLLGTMIGLDRTTPDIKVSIPGRVSFTMSKSDASTANPWVDSAAGLAADGPSFVFNGQSSGSLNPTDDSLFYKNLLAGYHDGPSGPAKFELRNIDASNSEYTGDLKVVFNSPTSFQVIDDNQVVRIAGSLRDEEVDTLVEFDGISFVVHREGIALTPKDLDENGFFGVEVFMQGFTASEGKASPVTVNIPTPSEISARTGQITRSETDIDYNLGLAKATPVARKNLATLNAALAPLDSTFPTSTVTVDSTRAQSNAVGTYRIEFGFRTDHSGTVGYDPFRPHDDPNIASTGDNLGNQVLKVYINGSASPSYEVDLNPLDDAAGISQGNTAADLVTPLNNSDFNPEYNFFAEMQSYDPNLGAPSVPAGSINNMYDKVRRQIQLPNGVVINIANLDQAGKVGRNASSYQSGSANFMLGDSYTFDITNVKKAGLSEIGTYSATYERGEQHSTNIEVFDSLGGSHILTTTFEHVDKNLGEWAYFISLDSDDSLVQDFLFNPPPGFRINDPKNPTDEEIRQANDYIINKGRQGKMFFTEEGKIDLFNSSIPNVSFKPADAEELDVKLDMNFVTQFEAEFGTAARFRTGNAMGLLDSFSIDPSGELVGSFSNGNKAAIGQIAIASFNNPAGLIKGGNNTYNVTSNSGIARIGKAGADDRGLLSSGVLEGSNVDLTEEFTELIVTQRSFSANGRIITTSDEFLQEILQLKR
ncbi:MAG: flagellar hook-basal body complex protein [Candidatus Cloacimonetes bacterium]|nr:flagellar hook-basal body complex protein [Candidatus Cloacimonadota bacterium]